MSSGKSVLLLWNFSGSLNGLSRFYGYKLLEGQFTSIGQVSTSSGKTQYHLRVNNLKAGASYHFYVSTGQLISQGGQIMIKSFMANGVRQKHLTWKMPANFQENYYYIYQIDGQGRISYGDRVPSGSQTKYSYAIRQLLPSQQYKFIINSIKFNTGANNEIPSEFYPVLNSAISDVEDSPPSAPATTTTPVPSLGSVQVQAPHASPNKPSQNPDASQTGSVSGGSNKGSASAVGPSVSGVHMTVSFQSGGSQARLKWRYSGFLNGIRAFYVYQLSGGRLSLAGTVSTAGSVPYQLTVSDLSSYVSYKFYISTYQLIKQDGFINIASISVTVRHGENGARVQWRTPANFHNGVFYIYRVDSNGIICFVGEVASASNKNSYQAQVTGLQGCQSYTIVVTLVKFNTDSNGYIRLGFYPLLKSMFGFSLSYS